MTIGGCGSLGSAEVALKVGRNTRHQLTTSTGISFALFAFGSVGTLLARVIPSATKVKILLWERDLDAG